MIGPAGFMAAPKQQNSRDNFVQCTRCRNKHREGERIEQEQDKHGFRTMACPRCGGHNFYMLDENGKRVNRL